MVKRGLTRDGLVVIAHDYVATHGLDALSMRRLAAAAGVTPGALYKHFRDARDLHRAMADTVFAAIDLSDIDVDDATVEQVVTCCVRLREAMLTFRNGGRIVAGSYSPFAATIKLSATLRALLQPLTGSGFDAGTTAYVLRSYTVGFVIEEQAYLELDSSGEWPALVAQGGAVAEREQLVAAEASSDAVAIMTGDRDRAFVDGLRTILADPVRRDDR